MLRTSRGTKNPGLLIQGFFDEPSFRLMPPSKAYLPLFFLTELPSNQGQTTSPLPDLTLGT